MNKEILLNKIKNKSIKIGVVGLGYVGLPLAIEFACAGFKTLGFDINDEKIGKINSGDNYIEDIDIETFRAMVTQKKFLGTSDFSLIKEVDFIAICVPTPLNEHQSPELDYIKTSAHQIAKNMKKESIIVLESTTYPGTTENILKPILEKESKLICNSDFYLGFSPERVDPGNKTYNTKNTPKVVGAIGEDALETISAVYEAVLDNEVYKVSSPAVAEMEKILENTFRNVNIGLVNELAMLCHKMEISIWEVIEAASTKPYGFMPFYPGPGLGGHCIPLDPYYLSWRAKEFKFHTSMIETSMVINDQMPQYIVNRSMEILNLDKKAINGSNILILGIAYKSDIDDYRESPALEIIDILKSYSANVKFYDPYIREYYYKGESYISTIDTIDNKNIKQFDLVIITTNHKNINYDILNESNVKVFDTRNAMKDYFNNNIYYL